MSKPLILHPRGKSTEGKPTWHDSVILSYALEEILKGKTGDKMFVFLKIAGKIQIAQEEAGWSAMDISMPVETSLRNSEARLLWREIEKLKPEQYGRDRLGQLAVPPAGYLIAMLESMAEQLGESLPEPDEETKEA